MIGAIFLRTLRDGPTFCDADVRLCRRSRRSPRRRSATRTGTSGWPQPEGTGEAQRRTELQRVASLASCVGCSTVWKGGKAGRKCFAAGHADGARAARDRRDAGAARGSQGQLMASTPRAGGRAAFAPRSGESRLLRPRSPEISDAEYDRLFRELQAIESEHPELRTRTRPLRVGAEPASALAKHTHLVPMISLATRSPRRSSPSGRSVSRGSCTTRGAPATWPSSRSTAPP